MQNKIVSQYTHEMYLVLNKMFEDIWANYEKTGQFQVPTGNAIFTVNEEFYRQIILRSI